MGSAAEALAYLEGILRQELEALSPCVERLSIALGLVELALTARDVSKRQWPADLPGAVDTLAAAFDSYVAELAASPALAAVLPAVKVKAVADAVWSKLNKGSYSKDLLHAQHVYCFAALLLPGGPPPGLKKQLDCAGVVTTTFAICQALALRFPAHADLAPARMQVSEDHCWIQLDANGAREGTVEVTTDTAAKRGLPVATDAWRGWLYTGGHAVLCSPHQALAALVTSLNPSVTGGKKGVDCEQLQAVQRRLLEVLAEARPDALYPAALCALADLKEVADSDELETARDRGDAAEVARLLRRCPGDSQDLFERAIQLACSSTGGGNGGSSGGAQQGSGTANGGSGQNGSAGGHAPTPVPEAAAPGAAWEAGADGAAAEAATDGQTATAAAAVAAAGGDMAQAPQRALQEVAGTAVAQDASIAQAPTNGNASALAATGAPDGSNGSNGQAAQAGWQWYVNSYLAAFLARRAEYLASCAKALPAAGTATAAAADAQQQHEQQQHHEQQQQQQQQQQAAGQQAEGQPQQAAAGAPYWQQAVATYQQALQVAAEGAGVLRRYRFAPATDEQLFKDVEGVLEEVVKDGLTALAKRSPNGQLSDRALLEPLLLLWDGVCCLFAGKPKPSQWVGLVMKAAKLFSPEAREAAAASVAQRVASGPMRAARPLWRDLKPVPLRPLFESADVGGNGNGGDGSGGGSERAGKRQRR